MDESRLREIIHVLMSENKIPGLSIAIIRRSETLFAEGFGSRSLAEGLPATPNTLYGVGSVTKSFTALAVMKLVEKGLLSPEDPVEKYVELKVRPGGEEIRVEHLLTHSSGMPSLASAELLIARLLGKADPLIPLETIDDLLLYANTYAGDAVAKPGSRYFYLNAGYVILGEIIRRVAGKPYADFVRDEILRLLGMERSTFSPEAFTEDRDRMTPYLEEDGRLVEVRFPFHRLIEAAGGLLSSVAELSKYINMYLAGGRTPGGVEIISPRLLGEMLKPRMKVPVEAGLGEQYYAYGWSISTGFLGHRLVSHGGNIAVSSAYVAFLPDTGLGVAVLSNSGKTLVLRRIAFAGLALGLGRRPEELPGWREDELLDRLTGLYESRGGIVKASVRRSGGALIVEERTLLSKQTYVLIPEKLDEHNPVFYIPAPGGKQYVDFLLDGGEIILLLERYRLRKISEKPGERW